MRNLKYVGKVFAILVVALGLLLAPEIEAQQTAEELYEEAILKKEAEGDMGGAVKLFHEIIASFPANRSVAAKAQLQIGMCHEKLGIQEALKAYQLVLQNYGDQAEAVSVARARLAALEAKDAVVASEERLYSLLDDQFFMEAQTLSPDGTKLLGIHISWEQGQNVAYKDLSTGTFHFVTKLDWEGEESGYTYSPVWSPSGKEIAHNFGGRKDPTKELRITDLSGNTRTIYRCNTKKEEIYPTDWFPDGRSLLAVFIAEDKTIQLGRMLLPGGDFEVFFTLVPPVDAGLEPDAGDYLQPDLSPDGKHIVWHKRIGKTLNLYLFNIASREERILVESPAADGSPLWSPDGRHIAFLSDRLGNRAIWAVPMLPDGTPNGQPFLVKGDMPSKSMQSWTAQGITYDNWMSLGGLFLMPVDPESGAPDGKPRELGDYSIGRFGNPAYSPDGDRLAFFTRPQDQSPGRLVTIFSLADGETRSFRIPSSNFRASLFDLRWLPDGSGVSFSCQATSETPGWSGKDVHMVFRLSLDTGDWETWPVDGGWNRTDWRGDGDGFYYTKRVSSGKWDVMERDLETGSERVLFQGGGFSRLICSRDYSKLALHTRPFNVLVVDIETGEQLKEFQKFGAAVWSPGGDFLMALSEGKPALNVISYENGTSRKYDLSAQLPQGRIAFFDWSPKGDQVAFDFRYMEAHTYLMRNVIPEDRK